MPVMWAGGGALSSAPRPSADAAGRAGEAGSLKRPRAEHQHPGAEDEAGDTTTRAKIQQKYRKRQKDKTSELQSTVEDLRGHLQMLEQQAQCSAAQGTALPGGMTIVYAPVVAPRGVVIQPSAQPAEAPVKPEVARLSTEVARLRHLIAAFKGEEDRDATKEDSTPKAAGSGLSAFALSEGDMTKLKRCVLILPSYSTS